MCNWHVPVCVACRVNLRVEKNGVTFVEDNGNGEPYKLWDSDMWSCPGCGVSILVGFGQKAWANNFDEDFQQKLDRVLKDQWTVRERTPAEKKEDGEP